MLMERRTFVRATTGCITAAGVPVAVSAKDSDPVSSENTNQIEGFVTEVGSETFLTIIDNRTGAVKVSEVDENEEIAGDRISSIKENGRETKVTKNPVGSQGIESEHWSEKISQKEINEVHDRSRQVRLLQGAQIGAAVEKLADIPEVIERTEVYHRIKDDDKYCNNDCNNHWVSGTSMEFNEMVADLSKAAIVAAILAVIAASGSGMLATLFGNKAVELIVGVVAGNLVGASLTIGYYDYDLNYIVGSKKMVRGGYGLGPWKPGKTGLIDMFAKPGHSPRCDW